MDYLDPKKELRHNVILFTGYILLAVAIVMATLILLKLSYGFGLGKDGTVIQNGLVYFSSQPHPASIYVDGQLKTSKTNTRMLLPAGIYDVKLARSGYGDWQRKIELDGGDVEHFDYPFLFPKSLVTTKLQAQPAVPALMTQSPDRRWLIVQQGAINEFVVYDLKNPAKPAAPMALPAGSITKATAGETWQLAEWADDNNHLLLQHGFDGRTEYVMANRSEPALSVNLNTTLAINPAKLTLNNRKYDQYYIYDAATAGLQSVSLKTPVPASLLARVLAYKTYDNDTVLYITDSGAPAGKVLVKLLAGSKTYNIRSLPAGTGYLVDLTTYSGTMYVAVGATSDNRVFIYKDPADQLNRQPDHVAVSSQVLRVEAVNYLKFSDTAQYIMVENGSHFAVYDIENKKAYNYTTNLPLDAPQAHAQWMDGNRLLYVSGAKLAVFDYDNANSRLLMTANSGYLPAFAPDFKFVYSLAPNAAGQLDLDQTALLIPADQ